MVDQSLLDILVCPETKQPVRPAEPAVLETLNASIRAGSVATRGGQAVSDEITAGLIREDRSVLYPVRDDIPIMLIDQSIQLSQQVS